jgi:hypothetical protein
MKNLLKFAFIAVVIFAFSGCHKGLGPEDVVVKWVNHFYKSEFDSLTKYSNEKAKTEIDLFVQNSVAFDVKKKDIKIEKPECQFIGDTASCKCLINGKDIYIELLKKDGKWLVNDCQDVLTNKMNEDMSAPSDSLETVGE